MNKDIKELVIDYIEGNLNGELQEYVKTQIEKNEEFKQEYVETKRVLDEYGLLPEELPSPKLSENFQNFLQAEKKETARVKPLFPTLMKIAASILLVATGVWLGTIWTSSQQESVSLSMEAQIEEALTEMTTQSASARIHGINSASGLNINNDEIIDALLFTMNFDENTNVRLAALNALGKFSNDSKIKAELIRSLKFQDNPTIQIALINLLVELKETEALQDLKELLEQDTVEDFVKDEAQLGIFKLS